LPRARRNKQCWPEAYQLPAESVHLERKSVTLNYIVRITIATIWIMKLNIASMRYISIYSLTKRKKSCCHFGYITICFLYICVVMLFIISNYLFSVILICILLTHCMIIRFTLV